MNNNINFLEALTLVLFALKACGTIDVHWAIVVLPLAASILAGVALRCFAVFLQKIAKRIKGE